jgi:SAM-dependent methyltransferase
VKVPGDRESMEFLVQACDRHLDLGCGKRPRNPYGRSELHGIDVRPAPANVDFQHRVANLVLEPIPYGDNSFGSVSAYDFIEHVPRMWPATDGSGTMFPFIRLMNEIWRVLIPNGRLYALTPAFPHADAFMDPTHVNIITEGTHEYFCGDQPLGRMYGFTGHFRLLRSEWVNIADAYSAIAGSSENRPRRTGFKRIARALRSWSRRLRGKPERETAVYLLWEFEAVKPQA